MKASGWNAVLVETAHSKRHTQLMGSSASALNRGLLRSEITLKPCRQDTRDRLTDVLKSLLDGVALTHAAGEVQALDDITAVHLVLDYRHLELDLGVEGVVVRIPMGWINARAETGRFPDGIEESLKHGIKACVVGLVSPLAAPVRGEAASPD
jgi:hypothetical protein